MHVNYMTRTFTKKVFNMAEKTASMVFSSVKDPLMGGCLKTTFIRVVHNLSHKPRTHTCTHKESTRSHMLT